MVRFARPVLLPDPRVGPARAAYDDDLITRVMARWDAGLDTQTIALEIFESEAAVCVALRVGRERRRQGQ
jgi:hypothetical protein